MTFLFLLVLVASTAATCGGLRDGWSVVEKNEELWRFQVGEDPNFVNIGNEYLCLFTAHDRFVSADPGRRFDRASFFSDKDTSHIRGVSQDCMDKERFEVVFLGQNKGLVALRTYGTTQYISCQNRNPNRRVKPPAVLESSIGPNEMFEIHISPEQDRILLFNPRHERYLTPDDGHPHHVLTCGGDMGGDKGVFRGWKIGEKEAWEAKEELELITTWDGCESTASGSIAFIASVGVSTTQTADYYLSEAFTVKPGAGLKSHFVGGLNGVTVDWGRADPSVFAEIDTKSEQELLTVTSSVDGNAKVSLYEVVGKMGPFKIRGRQFKTIEVACGNKAVEA